MESRDTYRPWRGLMTAWRRSAGAVVIAMMLGGLEAPRLAAAGCDPPAVCGNGTRETGEACDGGAYCTPQCTFPSLAPGCCDDADGTTECRDEPEWSLYYYLMQSCLSHGSQAPVPGGICAAGGSCVILPIDSVPLCCASNADG